MKCEICGKTSELIRVYDSVGRAHTYCVGCGADITFSSSFFDKFFFSGEQKLANAPRCKGCGSSFSNIAKNGFVGCELCYDTFFSELAPIIEKYHGDYHYKSDRDIKINSTASESTTAINTNKLGELKEKLSKAIKAEEFETAAVLRDEIKAIGQGEKNE